MTSSHPLVDQVFSDSLRQPAGGLRTAYLEKVCGSDAELRQRVERLLRAYDDAASFLESPAVDSPATTGLALTEQPGAQIGPYMLLQQIGEGGFGAVFLADQERPVRRKVALKIIKPGMDTREVIARFEAERQALALMDHPNIAKVYDAGATENGRPYFVMELIQGVPISEYCDQCNLTTRERLELFATVCQAVQHAHQKGVIHRDIKPTNVLVAMQDGRPAPKIIDFGVAKAIHQQLTEHTLLTAFAQIVGTPLYMSPEQAELSALGVDTRSDIYSLGVLLYELLTGATPFDKDRLHAVPYDELRRIIREEEPPRPSTRISTLAADLATTVAEHRRTDARRLCQTVCGELDWIVMKSLDKDRNRRYETANGLARDIDRYLHDEPVHACPPSKWYSFRKFAARNKRAVTTTTVLALAVLVAVVTLAVTNVMIRGEKDRAEVAQTLAEKRADEIRQGLERLKSANALLDRGRWYDTQRRWDDAHAAFTKAIEMRPDHVSVWAERADLLTRLGLWDLAAADYAREIELREPDTTFRWYQHALLRCYVGDWDGYRSVSGRMRERFDGALTSSFVGDVVRTSLLSRDADPSRLVGLAEMGVASFRDNWYWRYLLGLGHYRAGQQELAVRRLEESLAAEPNLVARALSYPVLAMARHRLGRSAEAHQALGEAANVLDQWTRQRYEGQEQVPWWDYLEGQLTYREAKLLIDGSPPPEDARLHVLRARALAGIGWAESKAAPEYDVALKLSPHDPQIRLEAHRNQGYCFVHRGEWEQAADQFAKACELNPDDSYLWRYRAVASFASGNLVAYRQVCTAMVERFEKSEDRVTAGNVLLSCLLRGDTLPDMTGLLPLSRVAEPMFHWGAWARGAALHRAGRYEESVQCFEAAAKTYRPRAWDWCFLAMAHQRLGNDQQARRCVTEAVRWIDEANRAAMDDLTGTRPAWGDWHERVVYPVLLREAEQLLNIKSDITNQGSAKR